LPHNQQLLKEGKISRVLTNFFKNRYKFPPITLAKLVQDTLYLIQIYNPHFLEEGRVIYHAVSKIEPMGKSLQNCQFIPIKLTIYAPGDVEYRKCNGLKKLMFHIIQRITQEAIDQNGVLTHEDIANILFLNRRTVTSYIKELKSQGIQIITRAKLSRLNSDFT